MRRLPALTSPIPALWIALSGALAAASITRGIYDPDYFWHFATGRLILDSGRIPTRDPFSFTWFGQPWIQDQWLGQILIVGIQDAFGLAVLLVVFAMFAALGPALVAEALRREGIHLGAVIPMSVLACAALFAHVTARPQVISFAMLGALLAILIRVRPATEHLVLLLPPIFLIWANTHGFFIVGLGIGLIYLVATLAGRTPRSERKWVVLAGGLASLVATAVTPQGPGGILYAASFGGLDDWVGQNIIEWQSPNFHEPEYIPFLLLIVLLVIVGVRPVPAWLSAVAFVGMVLGLMALRSIGVAAILMLPSMAASMGYLIRRPSTGRPRPERRWIELAFSAVGSAVLVSGAVSASEIKPDEDFFPIAGVEVLVGVNPDARVLASFGWGGYVLHELHPLGGRVFVDGRMPKYLPGLLEDYGVIINAEPGWKRLADSYGVEAMLLRPRETITKGLAQGAGWCEMYRDELQVLLMRDCPYREAWED